MATTNPGAVPVLPKPLFSLDTRRERDFIIAGGQHHDVLLPEELTIVQHQRLMHLCPRYDELMAAAEPLSDDESEELLGLVDRIVEIVLVAPVEIRTRLLQSQRLAIVLAFTGLSRRLLQTPTRAQTTVQQLTAMAEPSAPPLTGAKKSPASHASTRARRRPRG